MLLLLADDGVGGGGAAFELVMIAGATSTNAVTCTQQGRCGSHEVCKGLGNSRRNRASLHLMGAYPVSGFVPNPC